MDASQLRPPMGVPTIVIHGKLDDVVPVEVSRRYCAFGATLIETDDDHRLVQSLDQIVRAVAQLQKAAD